MNEQLASLIRTAVKIAAGFLVARGYIDDSLVEPIIALALAAGGVWWSWKSHDQNSAVV